MKSHIHKDIVLFTATITIFCLVSISSKAATLNQCIDWFNENNHVEVIKKCSDDDSLDKEFITFASQLFLDISYPRINEILYTGKQMGSFVYKYKTGKDLYSQLEKTHLKNYFAQLVEFAEQGIPMAQLLTAKVFYINKDIIERGEQEESVPGYYEAFDAGMKKYYFPNLEQIVANDANHVEALALLGIESFNTEYIEGQYGSETQYYSIKDEKLYAYMLRAHELGHPGLQQVIDGVAAWNRHVSDIEKQANAQDPEALFKLGQIAYRKSHDHERFLDDAFNYYKQAADLGYVDALRSLNSLYASERFDQEKYLSTLKQLVELEDTPSMIKLGDIYLCNDKVEAAKKLYERAQNLNHPEAQFALDDLKYDGEPSSGCE